MGVGTDRDLKCHNRQRRTYKHPNYIGKSIQKGNCRVKSNIEYVYKETTNSRIRPNANLCRKKIHKMIHLLN